MSGTKLFGSLLFALALGLARAADPSVMPRPLFRDFMGVNGHTVQFRPKLYQPIASLVRDYHPVEWDLGKDSASTPPFPQARNGVDWKHVYGSWLREGWRVDACLMFESLARERWQDLGPDAPIRWWPASKSATSRASFPTPTIA
jgi:hypothetical protein